MNEYTNIITIEITDSASATEEAIDEAIIESRAKEITSAVEKQLKAEFSVDDVKVLSNQFFTREKGGAE